MASAIPGVGVLAELLSWSGRAGGVLFPRTGSAAAVRSVTVLV